MKNLKIFGKLHQNSYIKKSAYQAPKPKPDSSSINLIIYLTQLTPTPIFIDNLFQSGELVRSHSQCKLRPVRSISAQLANPKNQWSIHKLSHFWKKVFHVPTCTKPASFTYSVISLRMAYYWRVRHQNNSESKREKQARKMGFQKSFPIQFPLRPPRLATAPATTPPSPPPPIQTPESPTSAGLKSGEKISIYALHSLLLFCSGSFSYVPVIRLIYLGFNLTFALRYHYPVETLQNVETMTRKKMKPEIVFLGISPGQKLKSSKI